MIRWCKTVINVQNIVIIITIKKNYTLTLLNIIYSIGSIIIL